MKKISCFILIFAILQVSLVSCSGYNGIMRNHLKNPDNYQACEVILEDFYYIVPSTNEKKRDFTTNEFSNNDIIFDVSFFNGIEELRPFLGGMPNPDIPLEEYKFQFRVIKSNNRILLANGFFNQITVGEKISVRVSDFIYMDSDFFHIARLEYNGKEYLNFEEGLTNIIDMMNKNKSFF